MAQEAITLSAEAFAWLVTEHKLQVEGPFGGYIYTGKRGRTAWELYKTAEPFYWDKVPMSTGVTNDPAAGANHATVTVPDGVRWRLHSFCGTLVSSATGGNRYPRIWTTIDGTIVNLFAGTANAQTASLTVPWIFRIGQTIGTTSTLSTVGTQVGLGLTPIDLMEGATIVQSTSGLVAAEDDWGIATYEYQEAPL